MSVDLDLDEMSRALERPGIDPRIWVSYGIVNREQDDQKSVEFSADFGPLVWVILQPHNQLVCCRVASGVAGNGEGEWHPFMSADEVLVAIPEGDTRTMPVIVGRLNNSFDKFPENVGVQTTDKNNVSFHRSRGPYIIEGDSAVMLRSSKTGAVVGIDELGNLTMRSGTGAFLQINGNGPVMKTEDGSMQVALDESTGEATVVAGSALMTLSDMGASEIWCNGLKLSTCGNSASEHLITLEQVVNILASLLTNAALDPGLGFLIGPPTTGFPTRVAALTAIGGALNAIGLLDITATLPAILSALHIPKPPGTSAGQPFPGVGCTGLLGG
jgi:hypothetical protein